MMEDTKRVALYARVSSEKQAEELTIASQVEALRQRIEADGLTVDSEMCFLDEGYSGSNLVRPALERLRDLAHGGAIDRLYVHSPDRLARKYAYQVVLLEELRRADVEIVFLNDLGGQRSAEAELLLQMQGMFAEYERAKILERTRRGRRFAARQGKVSVLGNAPYGYRYVSKHDGGGEARFEIVAEEARVVQDLFAWVALEGLSLSKVVGRLAEHGVPSPSGQARWSAGTIRGILRQPAYIGTAKYGKTRLLPRKNAPRRLRGRPWPPRREKLAQPTAPEDQEVIPVPPLINEAWFTAAADKLAENRKRDRERRQGAEFLLGGLLVCHQCGSAYCGQRFRRRTGMSVYYRCIGTDRYRHAGERLCHNNSLHGRVDEQIWADLCSLLKDPARLQREFERRLQTPGGEAFNAAPAQKSIAQWKRRIARLLDAYENGWLDKPDFESRMRHAKERLTQEQQNLERLQQDVRSNEELRLLFGEFNEFAQHMNANLEQADFATRRKLVRLLIQRIEVDADEVRIIYKVQPRPFAPSPTSRGVLQHWLMHRDATACSRRQRLTTPAAIVTVHTRPPDAADADAISGSRATAATSPTPRRSRPRACKSCGNHNQIGYDLWCRLFPDLGASDARAGEVSESAVSEGPQHGGPEEQPGRPLSPLQQDLPGVGRHCCRACLQGRCLDDP